MKMYEIGVWDNDHHEFIAVRKKPFKNKEAAKQWISENFEWVYKLILLND